MRAPWLTGANWPMRSSRPSQIPPEMPTKGLRQKLINYEKLWPALRRHEKRARGGETAAPTTTDTTGCPSCSILRAGGDDWCGSTAPSLASDSPGSRGEAGCQRFTNADSQSGSGSSCRGLAESGWDVQLGHRGSALHSFGACSTSRTTSSSSTSICSPFRDESFDDVVRGRNGKFRSVTTSDGDLQGFP